MAEKPIQGQQSQGNQQNESKVAQGTPDYSKPGWPIKQSGIELPSSWYLQFPEAYRPESADTSKQFDATTADGVKAMEFMFGERASVLESAVNVSSHTQIVRVPSGRGESAWKVKPYGVITGPAELIEMLCKQLQHNSVYPAWARIAPKGNCGGSMTFQPAMIDPLGNLVNQHGEVCRPGEEPAKDVHIATCPFYGCNHAFHWSDDCRPLSIRQMYHVVDRVRENPETSMDLESPENLIARINAVLETEVRMPVHGYAMRAVKWIRDRAAALRERDTPVRWRNRGELSGLL